MIRILSLLIAILIYSQVVTAQSSDFISRGKIEYEIRFNQKHSLAEYRKKSQNNDLINSLPDYDIRYYDLTFSWGSSLYSPGRTVASSRRANLGTVFIEKGKETLVVRKSIMDKMYFYEDSLRPIKWKIQQETRKIAGFDCRKAIGVINDSVYVIAFYSQEIMPQSGPEMFTGLPGMILGVAIPQYYTTWFATKVELANINEDLIKPPSPGKARLYKPAELLTVISKDLKEYFGDQMTPEKLKAMFFNEYIL